MLAVLGILAAIMIPTLTGYITRSKNRQIQAETRLCVLAVQSLANEMYAKGYKPQLTEAAAKPTDPANVVDFVIYPEDVLALAELQGTVKDIEFKEDKNQAKVTKLTYQHAASPNGDGQVCTYTNTSGNAGGTAGSYTSPYK